VDGTRTATAADVADFSAVRVHVLLDDECEVLPHMVVRNVGGGLAGIACVRVVRCWSHPSNESLLTTHDFSDDGASGGSSNPRPATAEWSSPSPHALDTGGLLRPHATLLLPALPRGDATCVAPLVRCSTRRLHSGRLFQVARRLWRAPRRSWVSLEL